MRFLLFGLLLASSLALVCRDENGYKVDWAIMLKAPELSGNSNYNVTQGTAYAYMDPFNDFALAYNSIDQGSDAMARTMGPLYGSDAASSYGWVMYNDEDPSSGKTCLGTACGHTKGVLGFDGTSAFWILHSVPKYPPAAESGSYSYPHTGQMYGQSFLCISLSFQQVEDVANQLMYSQPHIYSSNIPSSLANSLPNLAAVINGQHYTTSSLSVLPMPSLNGVNFTSLAKTAQWGQSLYEFGVAVNFQTPLYIETWMRPKLASLCPPSYPYAVMDINSLTLPGNIYFTEYHDHSKWAVSANAASPLVCIGGINHQETQYGRSGGTMCFFDQRVYSAFANIITDADSC